MSMDRRRGLLTHAALLLALVACTAEQPGGRKDTAIPVESLPDSSRPPVNRLAVVWDTAAGDYFAVAGETPGDAFLIYPGYTSADRLDTLRVDSTAVRGLELELLGAADSALRARVSGFEPDTVSDCSSWPAARVTLSDGQSPARPWSIAFPPGRVTPAPFDSLPALSRADSTRLTIAVARAASKVEGDTAAAFRGRPFVVRQANRFRLDDGREAVLAEVVRVVTQEANPLQEQLLLILEADTASQRATLTPAFAHREIGLEEALASIELTGVLRLRDGTWTLLLHRELGEGSRFELLERARPGRWTLRWRSAYAGC